jgi:zinc protease
VIRILPLLLLVSCVTTRQLEPNQSPDPRDDLPELDQEQVASVEAKKQDSLAKEKPLVTVLEVQPEDPIVNFRIVFQAGSADDPAGKQGLAALTGKLMRQATEELSAAQLADKLFPWAAELDVQVDKDTIVFLGRAHRDHADAFADVLLDVILRPRLDKTDFDRIKREHKDYIESTLRTGSDEALQREALEVSLYPPGHPYHHTPVGTVKGIESITLDDVRAFMKTNLTRDRVVLGLSGGASTALVQKLKSGLETLAFSSGERAATPTPPSPEKNKALIIEKPSAGTAISIGYVLNDLTRAHPDYAAMKLAETYFGEHRNQIGHLYNAMRETRGLNYGDYAYVEHFVQEGWSTNEALNIPRRTQYFSMWIRPVEHKNRLFALRQAAWELEAFAKNGIPDDDSFKRIQSFVQGYWRAKEQEPMRRLGYAIDRVLTGQPFDRDGMRAKVASLTRADVNAAIKRHLHSDKLSVVLVTQDAAPLVADIVGNKPSPITYAAPKSDKKILDEDKLIEAFNLGLTADRIQVIPPSAMFAE